jgi:hypothetical protein
MASRSGRSITRAGMVVAGAEHRLLVGVIVALEVLVVPGADTDPAEARLVVAIVRPPGLHLQRPRRHKTAP